MYSCNDTHSYPPPRTCCKLREPVFCRTCCINCLVEDHTYCVLKNLCRKIIKELCSEQCQERYSVFDGGKSMNSRLYQSSNQPQGICSRVSDESLCRKLGRSTGDGQRRKLKGAGDYDSESDRAARRGSNINNESRKSKRGIIIKGFEDDPTGQKVKEKSKYERRGGDSESYEFEKKSRGNEKKRKEKTGEVDAKYGDGIEKKGKSKARNGGPDEGDDEDNEYGRKGKGKFKTKKRAGQDEDDNEDGVRGQVKGKNAKGKEIARGDGEDDEVGSSEKGKKQKSKSQKGGIESGDGQAVAKDGKFKSKSKKASMVEDDDFEDDTDGTGKKRKKKKLTEGEYDGDDGNNDGDDGKEGKSKAKREERRIDGQEEQCFEIGLFSKNKSQQSPSAKLFGNMCNKNGDTDTNPKRGLKSIENGCKEYLKKQKTREIPLIADLRMKVRNGGAFNFDKETFCKALSEGDVYTKKICAKKTGRRCSSRKCLSYRDFQSMKSRLDEIKFCDFLRADLEQRELCVRRSNCCCNPRPQCYFS